MTTWRFEDPEEQNIHHKGRRINKERFCKKNNKGHGIYGPHIYNDKNRCVNCNKTNPQIKRKDFPE